MSDTTKTTNAIPKTTTSKTRSMPLDSWNTVFEVVSVALLGLTFIVGAGALWTGHKVNQRQAARLVLLETDLIEAKRALSQQEKETTDAKVALLELQERLRPRVLDASGRDAMLKILKEKVPLGHIAFSHLTGTDEPGQLAAQLYAALKEAGWPIGALDGGPWVGGPPPKGIFVWSQ